MAIITVSNTGGNWNSPTTWVGGVVPLSTDSVVFTATSGNLNINVLSTITDLDLSNFTGTITFTSALFINGNWNLGGGTYTQSGASYVRKQGTGTITSNGVIWSRGFRFVGTGTTTLADDLNLSGAFQFQGDAATMVINGYNIYHTGTFIGSNNAGVVSGTTKYWYKGTGATWGQGSATCSINIDFYIDTVGTLTLSGTAPTGINFGGGKELKIISGTLNTSGLSALSLFGRIVNLTGSTINNLQLRNGTNTLLADVYTTTLTCFASATGICNGFKIFTSNLTQQTGVSNIQGTTVIEINGTGTWSNAGTGVINNNLIVNTPGTFTISGTVRYNTGTLTYTTGTVITAGSNLLIGASTSLNSNGISWVTITTTGTTTLTLLSNLNTTDLNINNVSLSFILGGNTLSVNGTLLLATGNGAVTFNVPHNLQVTNLTLGTGGGNISPILNGPFTISVSGNLTENHSSGIASGTTSILLNGTGTWTNSSSGALRNNLTISTFGTITISGSVKYDTGTLTYITGSVTTTGSTLTVAASTTLNTSSIIWNDVNFTASSTMTLTSIFIVGGNVILGNVSFTTSALHVKGNISTTTSTGSTGTIIINGTGSQSWATAPSIRTNLTINKPSGTLTISGTVNFNGNTLKYIAGTVDTTGSTLSIATNLVTTLDTNGMSWNNVTISAGTQTLLSNFTVNGLLTIGTAATAIGNYTINAAGGITLNGNYTQGGATTTTINLTGGTWSGSSGQLKINTNINGNVTISGTVNYNTGTLTYLSGSVTTTGSTLNISASTTLNTTNISGTINWDNVTMSTGTQTINSQLEISGTFTVASAGNLIFTGTSGFNAANFSCITAGRTITLASGITYNVTNNLNLVGTSASKITLTSGIPRAVFTLPYGAFQNVQNTNATNINSSLGQTINTSSGTLTNTLNWNIGSGNFFLMF